MKPIFKNLSFLLAGAYLFGLLILSILLNITGCQSDPAPRVIEGPNPGILKFKPGYDYLVNHAAVELDSCGNVINYTTPYDDRWARNNGFVYTEQLNWPHPYFTDLSLKAVFDYPIIYGTSIPMDTLKSHIILSDTVLQSQFKVYTNYGSQNTVELFDWWIEKSELESHAEKVM